MKLFCKEENWERITYTILGIKISKRKKKRPSQMFLEQRTEALKDVFYNKLGEMLDLSKISE